MHGTKKGIAFLLLTALLAAAGPVFATDIAGAGFLVCPRLPENQREGVTAHFDLIVTPGQTQALSIKVENNTNEDITVEVEANMASTNRSGDMVYVPAETLAYRPKQLITDMIRLDEKRIVIPANTERDIGFTVAVPNEAFEGIVLGSIRVLKVLSEAEAQAGGIVNQYAYSVPIRLRQREEAPAPDFYLEGVQAELVHFSASVVCNIVNPQPRLIRGMEIAASVTAEGAAAPLLEFQGGGMSMAPESLLPLTLQEQLSESLKGGWYTARVRLTYEGQEWNFEERFEITGEEAESIQERVIPAETEEPVPLGAGGLQEGGLPGWAIALIAVGVLLLAILLAVIRAYAKRLQELRAAAAGAEDTPAHAEG